MSRFIVISLFCACLIQSGLTSSVFASSGKNVREMTEMGGDRPAGLTPELWDNLFDRSADFIHGVVTTKMCFVAGTSVKARVDGVEMGVAIEELEVLVSQGAKVEVWAKDEFTGEMGWKRILAFFLTHPDQLVHLSYDVDGDGIADETLSGTHPHPFWVVGREEFEPMGEVERGEVLYLANGGRGIVTGTVRERAPPGETFTTYNFEVEDFHTYFVGESGVWVHNTGRAECERVFSVWHRFRDRGDEIWDAYLRTSTRLPNATDDILKKTMKEVSDIHKAERAGWSNIDLPQGRVQHTFDRHKEHWGFDAADNWNPANGDILKQRIQDHIADAATDVAEGKYRGNPATFFVNTDTGLAVVKNASGELTAAFKFSSQQKHYLLKKLSVN